MQIFLTCVMAAVVLFLLYQIIPKMPSHTHREVTSVKTYTLDSSKPVKTEEEIEHEKELRQLKLKHDEFVSIMNYDVETAYRKRSDFE